MDRDHWYGGTLTIDDSRKEIALNTSKDGVQYPISSMPGEEIGRVFGGAMANETLHVVDAIARNRPALVKSEEARLIMDIYMAANLSVERDEPIALPHNA